MVKQVIVVRKDLNMRKGKLAAQVAHASLGSVLGKLEKIPTKRGLALLGALDKMYDRPMMDWLQGAFTKVVVSCESETELNKLCERAKDIGIQVTPIIDAGRTEFGGVPTLTCAAFGPEEEIKLNTITGELKLL